jgi:hypothetical protein
VSISLRTTAASPSLSRLSRRTVQRSNSFGSVAVAHKIKKAIIKANKAIASVKAKPKMGRGQR